MSAGKTFARLPDEAAAKFGDREALTFKDRRYSFRQLAGEIRRVAKGLIDLGVEPGDKVAIWLTNCPEWIVAMFAVARIGAIHVPVNTRFRTDDVRYVLEQSNTSTLITHDVSGPVDYLAMVRELVAGGEWTSPVIRSDRLPDLRRVIVKSDHAHPGTCRWRDLPERGSRVTDAALEARAAAVKSDDTVFIMYTSGTTGFPKGVMRTHVSMIDNHRDRLRRLQMTERDVFINYLPLFHIFGYVDGPLGSMLAGYRQVLTESFDPDETLDLVARERGTQMHGFETHARDLCNAQEARPRDIGSLRTGIFAVGAANATATAYRARKVLAPMRPLTAYGITEIGANVSMSDLDASDEQACETSGRPCEGFELRVVDPDTGRDQPIDVPGEIVVKTPFIMQGYYRKPEETAKAFDAGGWFHTGDMGVLRADGYLRYVGRDKDMLKVGGENVDPLEVEHHLLACPGVQHVAVVGYPDRRLTEVGVAFVVRAPDARVETEDIIGACRGRIASFKIPRHVVFVDSLPMTASGKVQKVKLRERALAILGMIAADE